MSKTVTLRLRDDIYERLKGLAKHDNRPLSNFIETATLRFVEEHEYVDEFEMSEIKNNTDLNLSLQNGIGDAKAARGRFA